MKTIIDDIDLKKLADVVIKKKDKQSFNSLIKMERINERGFSGCCNKNSCRGFNKG